MDTIAVNGQVRGSGTSKTAGPRWSFSPFSLNGFKRLRRNWWTRCSGGFQVRYNMLPMFCLELTGGLRRGELLALLWTDLDVEKRTITVNKSVSRINGELVVPDESAPEPEPPKGKIIPFERVG